MHVLSANIQPNTREIEHVLTMHGPIKIEIEHVVSMIGPIKIHIETSTEYKWTK